MLIIIKDETKIIKNNVNNNYKYQNINILVDTKMIKLDNGYYFNDGSNIKKLKQTFYSIIVPKLQKQILVFVYNNNYSINSFEIYENRDFVGAYKNNASIIFKDPYLKDYYIVLRNRCLESNTKLLVNHHEYHDEFLNDGDYIELLSFSFYYFKDFLYINNLLVDINIDLKQLTPKHITYSINKPTINNYYELDSKQLVIDEIEPFVAPNKTNNRKLALQMGPTLTMSLAMLLVAGINVYNSYLANSSIISMAAIIIMPITMLISGILWPILTSTSEKRAYNKEFLDKKNEYLAYLKEYEEELIKKIDKDRLEASYYLFNHNDIKTKLFFINNKSKEFLKITLGTYNKHIDINIKKTKDKEIDEYLNRIVYRLNDTPDYPLFLDIRNNKINTFIVDDKNNYLNLILLELITKYSYEDIKIAIYSKNKNLFKEFVSIPHLFINDKRLTLMSERELYDLNNIKTDKPIILLLYDYSDISFNKNITTLLFTNDSNKILKESNSIIEIKNNKGLLNKKINFIVNKENIDFESYYTLISTLQNNDEISIINSFNDIYNGLDIEKNYLNNQNNLIAKFGVINNEVLDFDLHESKDGPHGLIGGSTGSGKSELIVSMLLSLAIRYSPLYLNIILIDYKGGGIKESLSYNLITIPHIIADISNLEEDTFERLMVAISRECKRRQLLFKELSNLISLSISNLDDYLKNYTSFNLERLAHILIVVDEFAELKKENPDIIKELISLSRIGRSLGIHLILATQKPGGVIDEEIWSNSHFKIALKVHSEKDSIDIIKSKDASFISKPGDFILQVDENYIKAKAIYSKKDINNNDQYEVEILDNELQTINKKVLNKANQVLENSYICSKIIDTCKSLNIKRKELKFERPDAKKIEELKIKYKINNKLILGEVDDYLNATKDILSYDFNENLFIYSNRNNEINNLINQLNENSKNIIIISKNKYVGGYIRDSLSYEDEEDIIFLFNKLIDDTNTEIHLIIEDLNTLLSYNEEYLDYIYNILRRSDISNTVIYLLTKSSNINYKLLNSFKNKICIDIYDNQDLINIYSLKGNYKGKSYFFNEMPITFIPCVIDDYRFIKTLVDNYIDIIPNNINYDYSYNHLLIGYDRLTRKPIYLKENEKLLITGLDEDILNIFKKLYLTNINVKVLTYDNKLNINDYLYFIWVGDGIYYQHLIYVDRLRGISKNEAYLFKYNKPSIIRTINYE